MDSVDSSSSSVSPSRDGSSSLGDDDGLISFMSGLGKEAALLFQSGKFTECLEILNQILQKKENDPKVLHNIAVAEYFRDGCSNPRKLIELLNNIKKRSEDLARAAGEQVEASNVGNNASTGSKGSSTTPNQFSPTNSIAYTDEFDTSVAKLNIAVVLFHLHEYGNALSVLEPLYQNIEPIDETTALHICLLLLDVALASSDAPRAVDVIQYLEKSLGVSNNTGQGDSGNTTQHQSSNPPIKASLASTNSAALEISNLDSVGNSNLAETRLSRTLSDDETLEYDALLSKLDIGGQNLARPSGFPTSNDLSRTSADRPAPTVDLKLKLHLYRVRLLLLTRNFKAAKREVKLAMNIARGKDSSTALLLKSQLEYARGNHRKAIKLLMTSSNRTEPWMQSILNNNLGCIYHQLHKEHTATLFFSKSLKSSSSLRSEKPLMLSTFSQDKSLRMVYNCGLQYLACGKPIVAFHCFQKSSSVFYDKPVLWLRIAECCLSALEKGLVKSSGDLSTETKVHIIGKGKWRQLLVEDGNSRNRNLKSSGLTNGSSGSENSLSMSFARQCLHNALYLLNGFKLKSLKNGSSALAVDESSENSSLNSLNHKNVTGVDSKVTLGSSQATVNGDAKDTKGGVSLNNTLQISVASYKDICMRENNIIKQAVLADLAYVELCLEDPLRALMAAKSLLRLPECSRIYVFLANVYAAEALCHLNRPKEASEHLSVYMGGNSNIELPYSEEEREKWGIVRTEGEELNGGGSIPTKNPPSEEYPDRFYLKPEEARGSLYVNLSTMSAMQGDLEQAHRFATEALSILPQNPKVVLTSVYVDLLLGKTQDALMKLKMFDGVSFLSTSVPVDNTS